MKKFLPKKLWLLRAYVSFLIGFTELLLSLYVIISIINFFSRKTLLGDIVLGLGGLYLVAVSLSILFVAQIILLFIGIHDNIDDMRKKALDENFTVDLVAEKEKENSNIIHSVFLIAVIVLSIVFSILSLTGESTPFAPNTNNSISQNSLIDNNIQNNIFDEEKLKKDILTEQERKEKLYSNFLGFWEYDNGNGWGFTLEIREDYKVLYLETRQQDGYEILQPRIPTNSVYLDFNGREFGGESPQNCKTNVGVLDYLNEDYINFRVTGDDPCGVLNDNGGIGVFKLGNVLKLKRFRKVQELPVGH